MRPLLLLSLLSLLTNHPICRAAEEEPSRALEDLSTVAISTFLLELTIQRRPSRRLRGAAAVPSRRRLSADETIQSLAESHLAGVYADRFADPSQVLLTVVTVDDDDGADDDGAFYVRSSFVGGVVSFPAAPDILDGSDQKNRAVRIPSRSEIARATMEAFAIPGYGQDFLNDLLEAREEELEGLLLVRAEEVSDGDSIRGENGQSDLEKVGDPPSAAVDAAEEGEGASASALGGLTSNIWAVAAVAALGAMFLTILTCTTVLWCDWRKRKARKERIEEQKMSKRQQSAARSDDCFRDNLRVVNTMNSEETDNTPSAPSPSAAPPSDELLRAGHHRHQRTSSTSLIGNIRRKSTAKSKAAQNHLQLSRSVDDEDPAVAPDFVEPAPSVAYSVGEDTTTMLYPAIHRGRQNSRDLSEFDGYSMDGMSAIEPAGGFDQSSAKHPLAGRRSVACSGEAPRDFDSVWDDESKITDAGNTLLADDDSILGKSIAGDSETTMPTEQPVVDLSSGLNRLDEDGGGSSPKNFLNEFDSESEDESSANRGAFTLELLEGSGGKSKRRSFAPDDDDSILGDFGGRSEMMGGTMMEEVEEEGFEEQGGASGDDRNIRHAPSGEESVDSSPSWAGRIKSALMLSSPKMALDQLNASSDGDDNDDAVGTSANAIFRSSPVSSPKTSPVEHAPESQSRTNMISSNILGNQASPASIKDKFVSSLGLTLSSSSSFSKHADDEGSVTSARSAKSSASNRSNASGVSRKSNASSAANRSKSKRDNALGLTNSMDEEVDEDPADMIENINSMLSECRMILDTDVDAAK